ncbi:MAG: hypothetical protein IPK93_07405 [Solirubrobacterales bacterium]|nr:hypothetical protein [Solirubrobacterales bacterium]
MEALFQQIVVGVVPTPREMPPQPFGPEDLQRAFIEASKEHRYEQFNFLPGDNGAQFQNSPDDVLLVQPDFVQIRLPIDGTPEQARERSTAVFRAVSKRLEIGPLLQVGIKVIAQIPIEGSALEFMGEKLLSTPGSIAELGPKFLPGGVKFRSIDTEAKIEANLLIEPYIHDDSFLFLDYDAQHMRSAGFEDLGGWLDEAFSFVRGPAMHILDTEA